MASAQVSVIPQGLDLPHACRPLADILSVSCLGWGTCTFTIGLYNVGHALITRWLPGSMSACTNAKGVQNGLRSALAYLCDCLRTATVQRSTT